jgi:hypothetical protein
LFSFSFYLLTHPHWLLLLEQSHAGAPLYVVVVPACTTLLAINGPAPITVIIAAGRTQKLTHRHALFKIDICVLLVWFFLTAFARSHYYSHWLSRANETP